MARIEAPVVVSHVEEESKELPELNPEDIELEEKSGEPGTLEIHESKDEKPMRANNFNKTSREQYFLNKESDPLESHISKGQEQEIKKRHDTI